MRKLWWLIGALAVLALLVVAGPWVYGQFIAEDDDPAATVSTEGAEAAGGEAEGQWVVDAGVAPNETSAGYTVHEILNGASVTVVGSTAQVNGSATVEGTAVTAGEITVNVASITTDESRRDSYFRDNVMDVEQHPTATFTLDQPVDVSSVPDDGTIGTVTMNGTLTLKGESRPVTVETDVLRTGERIVVSGSIPVTWSDYGVTPPSLGFVSVDGNGSVDFLVSLDRR
ncbi:YceI family protein [Rhodococcus triatomae]|uniref:Polyisoprenoid-binding protein YceI n=1 Tax=Rhodococcus triatomae TaxID=300028 RepID=A0A1G8I7D6_9NOCA|nr:YceI family protein [Rhodococcus triatomae]QNG20979.1 YceI family protein [Rhodococcus triatomae]QNG23106.1 YceI family protein [Rhodococcus triatomae]SDI14885.1 Polyisoprenoid-binding protein YceI [Rhodococcus triatomae]